MKLSVIIVNYNVKYYLEQCLESLQRALEGIEAEVFVVDNHSSDGSIAYLEEEEGKRNSGKGQELHQELQTDHLCALYVGPVAWEDKPKFVHSNDYQRDNTRTIKLRKEYFSCFIHRFV